MALLQSLRRVLGLTAPSVRARSIDTNFTVFREGDRVLVHSKNPQLTKPLRQGDKTHLRRGHLDHDRVIGNRVWGTVQAHRGPETRLSLPTLEEYVALTPRMVTPIYAQDASLIVSLLDIHVESPADHATQPPLEILEAGTGHGSLTLHLARAIQAANPIPPLRPTRSQIQFLEDRPRRPGEDGSDEKAADTESAAITPVQQQWDTWRAQRNAIVHTVDVSAKFSALAEKNVQGFRRGIYAGNVDFYVGHVENWIAQQTKQRTKTGIVNSLTGATAMDPFLSYAILDMPSAHLRIPHVAPVLKQNGLLVVFMPSITQIGECTELIRKQRLPFVQQRVVELGAGLTSGRLWDVRFAVKKSGADPASWGASSDAEDGGAAAEPEEELSNASDGAVDAPETPSMAEDAVLVCRPKVGVRTFGGGFVGVWRRIEDRR
ncbi:tRNA (adenine-N(1)-)-methyltransferase [Penicillium riverlandense]|uniref:tRNA (adenine-N(1)-)-methyltransferase n=1 Tax=Penicillium riverlandense TaxID=1903569 RepID=UPI002546F2ED|nr:tRNA (adenine-N(1)-)-methyltransferase [Penicillium riverlandense]KAJ5814896.1 tRNA (adenine-N(1)-)-methyltransferase [Penicillium riverlandense]